MHIGVTENTVNRYLKRRQVPRERLKPRTHKPCTACGIVKEIADFDLCSPSKGSSKRYGMCVPCNRARIRGWYQKNRERCRANANRTGKIRYDNSPQERAKALLRSRLAEVLRKAKAIKTESALSLLGCSLSEFMKHIESQWEVGMNWDNRKRDGWHIDHIRPCASFDLTDPEQQRICFHYTNLQPLWAADNFRKHDKVDWVKTA